MITILISSTIVFGTIFIFYIIGKYFDLSTIYIHKFNPIQLERAADYIKNTLTPRGFEFFVAELFKELGYTAKVTQAELDWGRDVILNDGDILVECKQYKTSLVGRDICFKLIGSAIYHKASKCIVVNTGSYNKHAYTVEKDTDMLELWDMITIMTKLRELGEEKTNEILRRAVALQGTVLNLKKEDDEPIAIEGELEA